jgi:hypothetical protein
MASIRSTCSIPDVVARKISKVRRQTSLLRIAAGIIAGGALALGLFLLALAIDWWMVPFDTEFRVRLTSIALWLMGAGAVVCLVRAALRLPGVVDVTRAIDAQVPRLQERWTSITALAHSTDRPEVRGAEALVRQVFAESEQLEPLVDPGRIRMAAGLKGAGILLAAAVLLFLIPAVCDREQLSVLIRRFAHPRDAISFTAIQSETGDVVVAPRASVVLAARVPLRPRPAATLFIQDAAGAVTEHPLKPADASGMRFTFPVKGIEESFAYRFRSGDGQTDWHRVTVAERPVFRKIEFSITPPAYSRLPVVRQTGLPQSIQTLEGSRLEVRFESSLPLESFVLEDDQGRGVPLTSSDQTNYRHEAVLTETRAFRPVMTTAGGMSNSRPPRCEIVVYPDLAPSIEIANPGNELAVRPDDQITIAFDARDDFGVARAELVIHDPRDPQGAELLVEPIPLGEQEGSKAVHGQVELDLKTLARKHGDELQYSIRVYDTKNAIGTQGSQHESANDRALAQAAPATESDQQPDPGQSEADRNENDASDAGPAPADTSSAPQATSGAPPHDPREEEDAPSAADETKPGEQPADSPPGSAAGQTPPAPARAGKPRAPGGELAGAPRPPHDMRKRLLDAGAQCTSCSRRKLTIDEWAGSFASQVLEKLQIQIDPVLKELRQLLAATVEQLEPAVDHARAGKEWDQPRNAALATANESLAKAEALVRNLTGRTDGTPYAFIGLQLQDIVQQHIQPAHNHLHGVLLLEGTPQADDLAADLTHVRRALDLLAALTREYETVKLNQRLADAAARVKKMHQVFLEGALAMLKSRKPNLNPRQRAMMELELSEEFLTKLRELLERKEATLAELARILSTDPRLLERYMARTRLEATSLRDQLTLLARREQELHEEVVEGVPGDEDKDARFEFRNLAARRTREAQRIAEDAAVMSDNFTIWLPRDLDPTAGEPARFKAATGKIATLARDLARDASRDSPDEALKTAQTLYRELCEFEEQLPALLEGRDSGKLATHIANRLAETERLITQVSGWAFKETRISEGKHHLAAQVDQHRIAVDTANLSRKLASLEAQCRGMTPELAESAKVFLQTMDGELLGELEAAQVAFGDNEIAKAIAGQKRSLESFAKAGEQLDEVIDGMIRYLDSQPYEKNPPPPDPNSAPALDDLLALLENEAQAVETLGIPCRPANLMIEKDWLASGSSGSGGTPRWNAGGVVRQTREDRDKAAELERQTRKALGDLAKRRLKEGQLPASRERRWNTLGSQLDDVLRQGRNNIPPEQYREAIERYFESLAGQSTTRRGK